MRSRATEVGFFSHGRDLAGFEPRIFRFQGFPEGGLDVSGFRWIHWATGPQWQIKAKMKE